MSASAPAIGLVSLGCPKALVDSERILTRLRAEGYAIVGDYAGADVVIVNTCGFLDSAKAESLAAIEEAMAANGRVIVTGCLGVEAGLIAERVPGVLAVTGPHQYEKVMAAVHAALPPPDDPRVALIPPQGLRLTPRHYAYLKISEGCDHHCRFCIIPRLRGRLVSRPLDEVMREAEALARAGVREILVVSQDTAAYGRDLDHAASPWRGRSRRAHVVDLAQALGELAAEHGIWVRLHYLYPYPQLDQLVPLMADGRLVPYLDIPFQHASPAVLKAMGRPAAEGQALARLAEWRRQCPDLAIRATFIVGFPGETEADFQVLLDWLTEARLERVACFKYENVAGAAANELPGAVPEEVKEERFHRLMAHQQAIGAELNQRRIGRTLSVLIDEVDADGARGRTTADAPEIDGAVILEDATGLQPGQLIRATVEAADAYDLWAHPVD
ncbi:30S ribosomal protein S12 methylthiotransferase RimO [Roseospirillum parvum]|uniref:Ribosomal protein uS12 methylthiotransferase RimO n=1 Tax=Roseospirillum parvum TaxID=83401 RepID=A0A1G7ZAV5_9PROT|nr:30S ribosomal protein S12 methylthiotransferase RimO [Roseospirillum parvum]SDH05871.1 ribosomal protein S12 methylthiotransferase [Roseospirillum parvum]